MYSKYSKCSPVWPLMNKNLEVDGPKAGPATQMPTQGPKPFLSFHCAIFSDSLVDGLMIAKWLLQLLVSCQCSRQEEVGEGLEPSFVRPFYQESKRIPGNPIA